MANKFLGIMIFFLIALLNSFVALALSPANVDEYVRVGDPSDNLEMYEPLGNVRETLTEFDLSALEGGSYNDANGVVDFNQYIRFNDQNLPLQSMATVYRASTQNPQILGDFLYAREDPFPYSTNESILEYEQEFVDSFDIVHDLNTLDFNELEQAKIKIMGDYYTVTETQSISGDDLTISMAKGLTARLEQGQTANYIYNGITYNLQVLTANPNAEGNASFIINGFNTGVMNDGQTVILPSGKRFTLANVYSGARRNAAKFVIDSREISFREDYISDDVFSYGTLYVNGVADGSYTDSTNYANTVPLLIGNQAHNLNF